MSTIKPEPDLAAEEAQPVAASAPPPIPFQRLKDITNSACESALSSASAYKHSSTESWNSTIINTTLQSLVKETSTTNSQPQYKFAVNSTIIQHVPASSETISEKRGMHSATAAYWNAEKDGMWNFKYDAAEPKGLDVVVQSSKKVDTSITPAWQQLMEYQRVKSGRLKSIAFLSRHLESQ